MQQGTRPSSHARQGWAKGALNIATEQGSGKRQADVSNTTFILEERAGMRERLLHAALSRRLSIGQDSLNTGDLPISQDEGAAELQRYHSSSRAERCMADMQVPLCSARFARHGTWLAAMAASAAHGRWRSAKGVRGIKVNAQG